ncbi:carotenoid biosynthesis protein [Candidatus Uhrbacteria bacterium]|nr:carotenoid biosynthesis protein [Candidatus Uhrbacteria bacterium]MBD3283847.1 carotenoid biosynthesis protein [Candidatus Uhrbacteria bacterium]
MIKPYTWTLLLLVFITFCGYQAIHYTVPELVSTWSGLVLLFGLAVPCAWSVMHSEGVQRGGLILLLLVTFAVIIEAIALTTGYPYGAFAYEQSATHILIAGVPILVPLSWVPLLLGSFSVSQHVKTIGYQYLLMITTLLTADLVIDPGAVALGQWGYVADGWWYHIPISNFLGWMVTGTIGFIIMKVTIRHKLPILQAQISMLGQVAFFTGVAIASTLTGAWFVGMLFMTTLFILQSYDRSRKKIHAQPRTTTAAT